MDRCRTRPARTNFGRVNDDYAATTLNRAPVIAMSKRVIFAAALVVAISLIVASVFAQQSTRSPWSGCCGVTPWPTMGHRMMGPGGGMSGRGMMGQGMMSSSMPRMHFAMMSGIPGPYSSMTNPLPKTRETVQRGAAVYEQNCSSCHGATGAGDGPASQTLSPRPANLALFSQMPMAQWDPFMYWTIAEGGAQFGSAMPSFKDSLSKDDIWAVIGYIQARLPKQATKQ